MFDEGVTAATAAMASTNLLDVATENLSYSIRMPESYAYTSWSWQLPKPSGIIPLAVAEAQWRMALMLMPGMLLLLLCLLVVMLF